MPPCCSWSGSRRRVSRWDLTRSRGGCRACPAAHDRPRRRPGREPGPGERAREIADLLRCPDCQGVSAAESSSKLALSVRAENERQLGAGRDQEAILEHFRQRYGDWILLSPRADGLPAVLWLLPVAALVDRPAGPVSGHHRAVRTRAGVRVPTRSPPGGGGAGGRGRVPAPAAGVEPSRGRGPASRPGAPRSS
ncbi:cytochrome c-type biogenesis protein [Nonomuraea jabiensis]|uniref:cytochrome c-type biogenesis protein n=1 Tax=Nonomuraea jabiensis TaxID=882448 RepID=UPI0035E3F54A